MKIDLAMICIGSIALFTKNLVEIVRIIAVLDLALESVRSLAPNLALALVLESANLALDLVPVLKSARNLALALKSVDLVLVLGLAHDLKSAGPVLILVLEAVNVDLVQDHDLALAIKNAGLVPEAVSVVENVITSLEM